MGSSVLEQRNCTRIDPVRLIQLAVEEEAVEMERAKHQEINVIHL